MKLIRCYVNNFGKLSSFAQDFDEKLTVINQENGFGKSTLCDFIKAMFYGFSPSKSKNLEENERLKYYPWQEGVFGGSIEFSCEKGTFRIERTFGKKASEDTFVLYNLGTGLTSSHYSENVGEELFGIDIKGFERCINIPSATHNEKMPISVSSKLSSMLFNTDDLNNYESAMAKMLKRARQYSTTGNRGIIFDLKREISLLQNDLEEIENSNSQIKTLSEKAELLNFTKGKIVKELENTRLLISKDTSSEVVKEKIKHYNSLVSIAKSSKEIVDNLKDKYNGNLPSENDIEKFEKTISNIDELSKKDDIGRLKKKRIIHSIMHSITYVAAAVLFAFGWGDLLAIAGALIIFADVITSIVLGVKSKTQNKKRQEKLKNEIGFADEFLLQFGIQKEDSQYFEVADEIKQDLLKFKVENAKFNEYIEVAKEYFIKENLKSVKQDIVSKTSDELIRKEKSLVKEMDSVSSEILNAFAQIEFHQNISKKFEDVVYKIEVAKQKLNEAQDNYNSLLSGMQFLKEAKEVLSDKYRKKIEESFVKNIKFLTDSKIENVVLSNDLDVSIMEGGFLRDYQSFSSGTKAIIEIALRLSVCEALFEKEKSFIIFDDSFVHLDDNIFTKMVDKTKKMSEHTQIVYFTCAKSRTL